MDYQDSARQVLAEHEISAPEYHILCTVGHKINLPLEKLANHTASLSDGDPLGSFTRDDYLSAALSCVSRGWLKIVSDEDCLADNRLLNSDALPGCRIRPYSIGEIDFTQIGVDLYKKIIRSIFTHRKKQTRSCWSDNCENRVDIYGETESECLRLIEIIKNDVDSYIEEGATLIEITPPVKIGTWRYSRFEIVSIGFHAVLVYETLVCDYGSEL